MLHRCFAVLILSVCLMSLPVQAKESGIPKGLLTYYRVQSSPMPQPAKPSPPPISPSQAPVPSTSQLPGQTLTLGQALDLAINNNPAVQAAQARLGISEAQIVTAGARPNPSIVSDNGIAEKTYRLGVEQTFQLGGKRKQRIAVARAQRDVVQAEINVAILDLRADLRRAYTRLYNAQQRLSGFEDVLKTNERLLSVAQRRQRAGDVPELDVLQAEVAAVRARNNTQNAFNEVVLARNNFNILIGQPLSTTWELTVPSVASQPATAQSPPQLSAPITLQDNASLQQDNLESLVQAGLSSRPELRQSQSEMTVNERQLALARAERIPNLTLAAGPDIVTDSSSKAFNAFIVGNLEIPLFNRQQGPILEAMARRRQLQAQQGVMKNRIVLEVTNAYSSLTLNRERVRRYEEELLPKAKQVVDMSQRSFEVGKSNILIPLNAQQAYMDTRLEYLQALLDYQNAVSDLERAVGTKL